MLLAPHREVRRSHRSIHCWHGHAARRSALPRERFSPLALFENWKGFLRLSLVTCPVALYPATSQSEKIGFNQINRNTGHRIQYLKVDADTGEEDSNEDITKAYKDDTDT